MPTAMRVWAAVETKLACPMTVRDGSSFLSQRAAEQALLPLTGKDPPVYPEDVTLECDDLWFRYEKDSLDVVKGFSLKLRKGEFYAILGGNGAGKSTTLKVISGLRTAYRGDVRLHGKLGHLPQNPQALFVKRTVREDLYEVFRGEKIPKERQDAEVARIVELCGLREFLDRHPYDISGGEQQRTALARVLLTQPDVLLLDEPTKGFDAEFKVTFALILRRLAAQGVTILMVSHDVPFCAEYAHKCGLFFDGSIVAEGTPREFFSGNSFYTTPANRMARHLIPQGVTVGDIIGCCCGKIPAEPEIPEATPLPAVKETAVNFKPTPLPLWRKLLAGISLVVALLVFFYATSITDLSVLINQSGLSTDGARQLFSYPALIAALGIFIAAIGRRSAPSTMLQIPVKQRKLSKRTLVATVLILLCIPLTIFTGVMYLGKAFDFSPNIYLKKLYTMGSGVTGITFAKRGRIQEVYLNAVASLYMNGLYKLETFEVESYAGLTSLTIVDCPTVDSYNIANYATNLTRVRFIDIDWTCGNADTLGVYTNDVPFVNEICDEANEKQFSMYTGNAQRIKKTFNNTGTARDYWTRSAWSGSAVAAVNINNNGNSNNNASNSYCVCPGSSPSQTK